MPGQVIADIGGSNARWVLLHPDGTAAPELRTAGLNLAAGTGDAAIAQLRALLQADPDLAAADAVHAYAAGAGSPARAASLQALLRACWPQAAVDVESDLTGAARALFANTEGVALILGTGMNAGHCVNGSIGERIVSLGYILGDEGSGTDLGRTLLVAALRGTMPADLRQALLPEGMDMDRVVEHLYRGSTPQAWLATHARMLAEHRSHPFVAHMLADRFSALAARLREDLPAARNVEVRATGAVAHAFQDELRRALEACGLRLTEVLEEPMPRLLQYHRAVVR